MNEPTRVCLFFTFGMSLREWDRLGILSRETALYRQLVQKGFEVTFFTYGDHYDLQLAPKLDGIKVLPLYTRFKKPKSRWAAVLQSFLIPFRLRKELREFQIFKTNQMLGAWVPLAAAILFRRKLVVRCGYEHYFFFQKQKKTLWKRFSLYVLSKIVYGYADQIVLTSEHAKNFVKEEFRTPDQRIRILPNFIDTDRFSPSVESQKRRENRLLFVGRFSKQKNLEALIRAAHQAGWGLDLVGSGELEAKLKNLAHLLGADVRFLGRVSNEKLPDLFSGYTTFVLPSHYEGNPKSLLEAMSCGLAVVGSDVEGIREVVQSGQNGLLCAPDEDSLSECLRRLQKDQELRERLSKTAREYVVQNCSLTTLSEREAKLHQSLSKERSTEGAS